MLPEFEDNGYLPQGIHSCPLEEVVARFGRGSPEREAETDELVRFVAWARQAGIRRLLIDGSYVTNAPAPNDVDLVLLTGTLQPEQGEAVLDSFDDWPFLHIQVAVDEGDLERWARRDFATDRMGNARGVVEIEL